MKNPLFIMVTKAEEDDESGDIYPISKLIRVSDIRDVESFELNDDTEGSLVNFYDGDSIVVFDDLDDIHSKIEGK
jgi:hypothetical protein